MVRELVKALTFDLWNTVMRNKDFTSLRLAYLLGSLEKKKRSSGEKALKRAYTSVEDLWSAKPGTQYRFVPVKERIEMILRKLNVEVDQEMKLDIVRYFEEILLQDPPALHNGAEATLALLFRQYPLGLVSDSGFTPGRDLRTVLESRGVLRFFSCTVFSDEVGYNKPNPRMFHRALELLEVQPRETVHVGDLLETDIAGAQRANMRCVWVNRKKRKVGCGFFQPGFEISELTELPLVLERLTII